MFLDASPTPLDLRFRLFGIPIRVHPLFWLVMALLGDWTLRWNGGGVAFLFLWVMCGFLSILVHELGHAVFIRLFGSPTEIVLMGFGGFATVPYPPRAAWQRLVIALAGPGAGFALLALVVGTNAVFGWSEANPQTNAVFFFLFVMNLVWNLFNLLPIMPLDGGKVCREVCALIGLRRPDQIALTISVFVAGALAAVGVMSLVGALPPEVRKVVPFVPSPFMTIWMVLLALESYQMLQQVSRYHYHDRDDDYTPPWRR